MGDDMLNCLLMISMNGPVPGTEAANAFLAKALMKFEEKKHYKVPSKLSYFKKASASIAIQTEEENEEDTRVDVLMTKLDDQCESAYNFDVLYDNDHDELTSDSDEDENDFDSD